MENREKTKILQIIEVVILFILIVVRLVITSEENAWISLLNYIGLILAVVSLYSDIRAACSHYRKFDFVTGVFVLCLLVLGVIAGLIFAEIIIVKTKGNDIILLLTLLTTLPMRLYESIIADAIKD